MTIFMEYPIIFMGYSISDNNIQNIMKAIVNCLEPSQIEKLEDRFIFVEYKAAMVGAEVTPYTIMVDDKPLIMKKISLSDFMLLYNALSTKKTKLPVRILRRFKQELYEYTITAKPTGNLRVASIDDTRLSDEEFVLAIGKASAFGLKGLSGLESNEWYRNIGHYISVVEFWGNVCDNLERATLLIAYLPEDQIDLSELESVLKGLFNKDRNILQNSDTATRTNIRRLIRIYD